jgi:glucose-1-phosphate cytidylyltransferase
MRKQTQLKPKAVAEFGGRPILWHIARIYQRHGFRDLASVPG